MPCNNCSHTVQLINNGTPRAWWCPRCGSLKTPDDVPTHEEPYIVQRAFTLLGAIQAYAAGVENSSIDLQSAMNAVEECCPIKNEENTDE